MADNKGLEFVLPVTEEQYETAGSKFVTFPAGAKVGDSVYKNIEVQNPDWDTPNKSIKFPVVVTEEGADENKEDKLSAGVGTDGIWKLKETCKNITGKDLVMKKGGDGKNHPVFNPSDYAGKTAVGHWQMIEGVNQTTKQKTTYPKLIEILPAGEKPKEESIL